jgi:hypothetical protein
MQNTTILKASEYQGLPFSIQEVIQKQVNLESERWYKIEKAILPKYTPTPKISRSAGLYNFIKHNVRQFAP